MSNYYIILYVHLKLKKTKKKKRFYEPLISFIESNPVFRNKDMQLGGVNLIKL